MRKMITLGTVLFAALFSFGQKKLLEGAPLKIKILQEISSKKAQVGDVVYFKLVEDLKIDSVTVISSNTEILGEVIEAQKARSLGRPGKLDFTINTVKAVDGQDIKLRATAKKVKGNNRTGGLVAAAIIFTPVALFIKGKDVVIEKDKEFLVFVDDEYQIKTR